MQGILVFASVMATLGLQIILESARTLLSDVSRPFSLTAAEISVSPSLFTCYYVTFSLTNEKCISLVWHPFVFFPLAPIEPCGTEVGRMVTQKKT